MRHGVLTRGMLARSAFGVAPRRRVDERHIMDIAYRRGSATAAEILRELSEPPSYSAGRALYSPTVSRRKARAGALEHLVRTFFDGSAAQAVSPLLDSSQGRLSRVELHELAALIEAAREKDRSNAP